MGYVHPSPCSLSLAPTPSLPLSLTSLSRSLSLSPALSFAAAYPTHALCLEYTFLRWHRHRLHRSLLSPSVYVSALSRSLSASSRRLSCRLVLGENCLVAFPCQIFGRLPWGSPASPPLSLSVVFFFTLLPDNWLGKAVVRPIMILFLSKLQKMFDSFLRNLLD